jgi:hypothetical protein
LVQSRMSFLGPNPEVEQERRRHLEARDKLLRRRRARRRSK